MCIASALKLPTVSQRNAQRTSCYNTLAKDVGVYLGNASELNLMVKYNISLINPLSNENKNGEVGLTNITSILQQKLNANQTLLSQKQTNYNNKLTVYNNLLNNNAALISKTNDYNKALSDKVLLTSQISTKQTSVVASAVPETGYIVSPPKPR